MNEQNKAASVQPAKPTPLSEQLAMIDDGITGIGAAIGNLESRIGPVLSAPNPTDAAPEGLSMSGSSPFADELGSINRRLYAIIHYINDITERVES